MRKFVYKSDRFSDDPDEVSLYEDKPTRTIHLRTFTEHRELIFPKDFPGGKFQILYNVLKEILEEKQDIVLVIRTMRDMCDKIPNTRTTGEHKQGVVSHDKHKPELRDWWRDGMTFEQWCSDEQIANEYYAFLERKKKQEKKNNDFDSLRIIREMLNNDD